MKISIRYLSFDVFYFQKCPTYGSFAVPIELVVGQSMFTDFGNTFTSMLYELRYD